MRRTASSGSYEYFFGNISLPSDLSGSELKPTTGVLANCGLNTLARPAVIKNVPSPPTGTKISAHLICSFVKINLKMDFSN